MINRIGFDMPNGLVPLAFVILGVAMTVTAVVTAAATGLSDALAITLVVLGVALVCLGGL
jgi:hypothetical protein